MAFKYKTDVLEALKNAGYTTYRLRHDKIMGESTLQKFRTGVLPSWNELDKLCTILKTAPWNIIEYDSPDD